MAENPGLGIQFSPDNGRIQDASIFNISKAKQAAINKVIKNYMQRQKDFATKNRKVRARIPRGDTGWLREKGVGARATKHVGNFFETEIYLKQAPPTGVDNEEMYPFFVHEGTKPDGEKITPANGNYLALRNKATNKLLYNWNDGQNPFKSSVRGQEGQPFLTGESADGRYRFPFSIAALIRTNFTVVEKRIMAEEIKKILQS